MKKIKCNERSLNLDQFTKFCDAIDKLLGLSFSTKDLQEVEKKLYEVSHELGFSKMDECINWLTISSPTYDQMAIFAKYFTVGETYFFRDSNIFSLFENKILPELIQNKRGSGNSMRIWCAACCTGEEPYSLAMLLDRLIPDINNWEIFILGSDVNPIFLHKAEEGYYKKWSFRATPQDCIEKYFVEERQGMFKIIPRIKRMVHYTYLNLVEDKYPSLSNQIHSMDLIVCNNVLIYFSKDKIKQTIDHLTESLVEKGYLAVSALEVPYVQNEKLIPLVQDSVTLFQKDSRPRKPVVVESKATPKKKRATSPPPMVMAVPIPIRTEAPDEDKVYHELFQKGNYDEIIKKLEKRVFGLESSKLLILLARSYANQGKSDKALKCLQNILKQEKLEPELYFFYATLLQETGQLTEAASALKKSLFLDQNYAASYYALGNVLAALGKAEEAARNYRNAEQILKKMAPDNFLNELGITVGALLEIIASIQKQVCITK